MLVGQQHELLVSGPAEDPNIYQISVFSCGAALALVVWDALLTLDDEVDHIWSKPGRTHVKWIYLFSKWFGLLNQIGIQIWIAFLAAYSPVPVSTCNVYFIFETTTFLFLQLCLDTILILRIWAVYQRHRRYITTALAIVFFEILMSIIGPAISLPKFTVDGNCIVLHTPTTATCLGFGILVSQTVLLSLTYRGKTLMQPAARRSKIATIVVRDGMLVFGVVTGLMLISALYSLFNQAIINVFLPWMPMASSILTPRIILNMQMAAQPRESIPEFTTDLGIMPHNEIQLSTVHGATAIYEQSEDPS